MVLAGNVVTSLASGTLSILGDSANNDLSVTKGVAPGSLLVTGLNGTTVNGNASQEFLATGLNVSLGKGDDHIAVGTPMERLSLAKSLFLATNSGNDSVEVWAAVTGSTRIYLGSGNDSLNLGVAGQDPTTFAQAIKVYGSSGTDTLLKSSRLVFGSSFSSSSFEATTTVTDPSFSAALQQDTAAQGTTNNDSVTSNPTITGKIGDLTDLTSLTLELNGGGAVALTSGMGDYDPQGNLYLDAARLTVINGGVLPDGAYTAEFVATFAGGQTFNTTLNFTLDTTAPAFTSLSTDPGDPLATTIPDGASTFTLAGMAEPGATARLISTGTTVTVGGGGTFQFNNVSFPGDPTVFVVQVTDSAGNATYLSVTVTHVTPVLDTQLSVSDVETLLKRAAAASASDDAIIAVVDRSGNILGVRTEGGVTIVDPATLVFAIDGAVAKARTAAFFSNNQAPLTSRTVRFISQSTITQREVESNPSITDPNSTIAGPGFVAPIGVGGHFPPNVAHTPLVDLFGIEHTNRDSLTNPGDDGLFGTIDDVALAGRFDLDPAYVLPGQELTAPTSYGVQSGLMMTAQSRGIATLPGGIPRYRDTNSGGVGDTLVGGIGVFFPGDDGYATHEQGFVPDIGQSSVERTNSDKVLEAEFIALAAAGGSKQARTIIGTLGGVAPVAGLDLPFGVINLAGIALEAVGPVAGQQGVEDLKEFAANLGVGDPNSGTNQPLVPLQAGDDGFHRAGQAPPEGWLVLPHSSADPNGLTAQDVEQIIIQGIKEANRVRAQIRLPIGVRSKMVFAVSDSDGNILGLFRMPDATVFSIDVAVAKARNTAYYDDSTQLQAQDQVPGIDAGVSFTARTFRFLAQPRFPSGVDGSLPPAFSSLNDPGVNPLTAENLGAPVPASAIQSVLGYDAFHIGTNFRDTGDARKENGIVFFPGSSAVYKNGKIVGGMGVSGDGVDQDDIVTFQATVGFAAPAEIDRADEIYYRRVRLPYLKFPRNPHA